MTGEVTYHDVSGVTVTGGRFPSGAWLKLRNLRLRKDKKADGTEEVVGFLLGDVSKKLSVTALVVPEFHFEVRGVWERYDQQVAALSAGAGGSATRTSSRIRGGAAGGAANGAAGGSSQQGAAGDAARQQSYTIVSSAGFAAVPTNTVAEVMALTRENPVGKFRLRVSLGDFSPKNPAEFPSYSKLLKQWNVHFNITLSDPSGSITAIVANEDFEEFTGVTQAEMRTPEGQAKCATVLKRLSAPDTRSEVCLKTHVSSNENDPRVKYWLFATHLLAQPRQPLQIERELFW
ncbi:hypothetical protein T484DRAFT_1890833 [Baffinella frigidus]|nr:hypothetical protein T484DRAFT_1890833 [Cryptophyta sp. CCMP2293]